MHIPGIKLVMPSTCFDTKGLLLAAIADNNPVIIIENRMLFKYKGHVPEGTYAVPIGKGAVRRKGTKITVAGASYPIVEAYQTAEELANEGIDAEVIDLRTLKPFDEELLIESVKKTGKLLLVDCGWRTGGVPAEIAATVQEKAFAYLKGPIRRVTCPDVPTPSGYTLEAAFYPGKNEIAKMIRQMVGEK